MSRNADRAAVRGIINLICLLMFLVQYFFNKALTRASEQLITIVNNQDFHISINDWETRWRLV